jgi:carboxymethylenebutenolidase
MALIGGGAVVGTSLLGSLACETVPTVTPSATGLPTAVPVLEPGMTVDPNDPRIEAGPVEFSTAAGPMLGYLSRPREGGPNPAILVIHENRGLQPHFPDVTRRFALEGYTALAIDLLSRQGGTGAFADSDQARDALGEITQDEFMADLNASVDYLQTRSQVQADRIGVTGFCFGGGLTWLMAVRNPDIAAAVPFYGSAPPLDEVANLNIPVLAIYAGNDTRIGEGVPDLEAALTEQNKQYRVITYPGADHGFFRDTGERYHPEAAGQAWTAALGYFGEHLKS